MSLQLHGAQVQLVWIHHSIVVIDVLLTDALDIAIVNAEGCHLVEVGMARHAFQGHGIGLIVFFHQLAIVANYPMS